MGVGMDVGIGEDSACSSFHTSGSGPNVITTVAYSIAEEPVELDWASTIVTKTTNAKPVSLQLDMVIVWPDSSRPTTDLWPSSALMMPTRVSLNSTNHSDEPSVVSMMDRGLLDGLLFLPAEL